MTNHYERLEMEKTTNRFSFPNELDLDEILEGHGFIFRGEFFSPELGYFALTYSPANKGFNPIFCRNNYTHRFTATGEGILVLRIPSSDAETMQYFGLLDDLMRHDGVIAKDL